MADRKRSKRSSGDTSSAVPASEPMPVPAGLRELAQQLMDADEHGVAPDVGQNAKALIEAAWNGSLCESIVGNRITLQDAVSRTTAALDTVAMSYMSSVPAEISAVTSGFDTAKFAADVVAAFSALKALKFDGHGSVTFDNLQAAFSKTEQTWRAGPHKNDLFVIQQFCLRIVQHINSLKQRTGKRIANDVAAFASIDQQQPQYAGAAPPAPDPPRVYDASCRIKGGPYWPQCVNGPLPDGQFANWARLFQGSADDGEDGPWLTPRMAARIHHVAVVDGDTMLEDIEFMRPCLPKVARPFFKRSAVWRENFRDCYLRIAMRLQKGLPPSPNCTGEEMALHNILERAPDADDVIGDEIDMLPEYANDDDFEMVKDVAVQDEDVLMLFENGDTGGQFGEDSDDEATVDSPLLAPGSMADFMLGSTASAMLRTANLHPSEWFVAFCNDNFRDHLPQSS